ncbi:MAG TPA: TetR/AcrR family transcriptional regulator [Casimicrobiaceae bacterium]
MAQKKAPRRTRERILDAALALFNRLGEPHVTTAVIADELNISPGNLYYHFRNKDEIIGDLYAVFEADVAPLLVAPADRAPQVDDLWFLLHLLFERMWAYRFLYRDLDEITSRNRKVAQRFALLTRRGQDTVIELCRGLVATGTMRATEREIVALARNAVMIATYWMSFRRLVAGPATGAVSDATSDAEPGFAAYHVLALIEPYLRGADRALIERLGADYLR